MRPVCIFSLSIIILFSTKLSAQTRLDNPREVIGSFSFNGHADDDSGFGNNGDVFGGDATNDRFGNQNEALLLDGINDWVGIDYSQSLGSRGEITFSIWAKGVSSSSGITTLIGRSSLNRNFLGMDPIGIGINDGSVLQVVVAGEHVILNRYINVQINEYDWNHYALTFSPGESVKVYLNGNLIRHFQDNIPFQLRESLNGLNIGVQSKSDFLGRTFFAGSIDEALIVKRALRSDEIYSIYSAGGWKPENIDPILDPNNKNLVAYYPFNGNANDESGNYNNGDILGPLSTTDRFERPNSAFLFDGINDRIQINTSESLIITGDLTLSIWVKPIAFNNTSSAILTMQGSTIDQGNSANALYKLNFPGDNILRYAHEGNGGINVVVEFTETEFIDENWAHIALLRDIDAKTLTLYKDGTITEVRSFDDLPVGGEISTLTIGENTGTIVLQDRFFYGKIDDIRVYDAVLNQNEILALYNEETEIDNQFSETLVSSETEDEGGNLKVRLYQNYPNPFNPSTTIQFDLEVQSEVQLKVFDITGRLIQTLVNSRLSAGSHDYIFDASNLSTGIYFYELSTANSTQIKKFTLIK